MSAMVTRQKPTQKSGDTERAIRDVASGRLLDLAGADACTGSRLFPPKVEQFG